MSEDLRPPMVCQNTVDARGVPWYLGSMENHVEVERIQTGVRMEKRLLKVLKGLAELKDMSLGDLLEGIVLHAFDGKAPFSAATLKEIEQLRKLYGLSLRSADSHNLREASARRAPAKLRR